MIISRITSEYPVSWTLFSQMLILITDENHKKVLFMCENNGTSRETFQNVNHDNIMTADFDE